MSGKTKGDPRIGSPVDKALFAKIQLLQDVSVLGQILFLEVIEQLATAGRHLEQPAARVEVLAVGAEVLGEMIDPGRQERDLHFAGAGIGLVGLELGDYFWLNYCGRHGYVLRWHDCRSFLRSPRDPSRRG